MIEKAKKAKTFYYLKKKNQFEIIIEQLISSFSNKIKTNKSSIPWHSGFNKF